MSQETETVEISKSSLEILLTNVEMDLENGAFEGQDEEAIIEATKEASRLLSGDH